MVHLSREGVKLKTFAVLQHGESKQTNLKVKMRRKLLHLAMDLWIYLFCFTAAKPIDAAFLDWIWQNNQGPAETSKIVVNGPLISVPYESQTDDEKFLEEASKFTELMKSSALDQCQHRVVLKIKTSCSGMTEEELAKMSVNLLNCQSEVDGRKIFPCTDVMSLKECTVHMDANMWNAYHMMNNRARAVCMTARRMQFHALSEMTVNKLMATTHDQINKLTVLQEGQELLETLTSNTLNSVRDGNDKLMKEQEFMVTVQEGIRGLISQNFDQLTSEKALITAGHKELSQMTQDIKKELTQANQQLMMQSLEQVGNHKRLLQDVQAVQEQAHIIFQKIDLSTEKLLAQHAAAEQQYRRTIENLIKINTTVNYLLGLLNATRSEIDERFTWIQRFLGGTGDDIEKISMVVFHLAYLLLGMLFASFLDFTFVARAALALIVPLNLIVTYNQGPEVALDFPQMTVLLAFTTFISSVIYSVTGYLRRRNPQTYYLKDNVTRTLGLEVEDTVDKATNVRANQSSSSVFAKFLTVRNFARTILTNLNQMISSFVYGSGAASGKSKADPRVYDETLVSSTDEEPWTPNTPVRHRTAPTVYHNNVAEWLQTKVNFPSPALSTSSKTSASSKLHCQALCRTGKRCRNLSSPGRDLCHRHLAGTSVAS